MQLTNTSHLPTRQLRSEMYRAARWAEISLKGVHVRVHKDNGGCAYAGRFIGRRPGFIKLAVRLSSTVESVIDTFVHELSHLADWQGYACRGYRIPRNREHRAEALKRRWIEAEGRAFRPLMVKGYYRPAFLKEEEKRA